MPFWVLLGELQTFKDSYMYVFMSVKLRFTSLMDVLTCLVVDSWCHKIGHVGTFR